MAIFDAQAYISGTDIADKMDDSAEFCAEVLFGICLYYQRGSLRDTILDTYDEIPPDNQKLLREQIKRMHEDLQQRYEEELAKCPF